jgi:hypothetical protein
MSIESISESASRYSKQEWATRVELAAEAHRRVETEQRLGIVIIAVGNSEI